MRAVMSKDKEVFVVDTPLPEGDGLLLHVTSSGICGSDLHMVSLGVHGVILGHEFGGYLDDGRLVAVRPTGHCGHCGSCATGNPNRCNEATTKLYGGFVNGGLADHVMVDPSRIVEMPPGASPESVALVEPLAVAIHGVSRVNISPTDKVLVVGGGSIGLFAVAALQSRGIDVDVVARHPHQQHAAITLGAQIVDAAQPPTSKYNIVFDAAATQSAFDYAVSAAAPGGTIVEYGMFWEPISLHNPVMFKELTIVPAMYYTHGHEQSDFETAARLVAQNPQFAEALVTHRFALSDAKEAFAVANNRGAGAIKMHLHP